MEKVFKNEKKMEKIQQFWNIEDQIDILTQKKKHCFKISFE